MADKSPHDDHEYSADEMHEMRCGINAAHCLMQAQRNVLGEADEADEEHQGEDDHRLRYERIPLRGAAPHGGFRLPHHAVVKLGAGDARTAGRVIASMFGSGTNDDPTVIHPDVVRQLGEGDLAAGHRVLQRFIAMLRRPGSRSIPQPDHNDGRAA